MGATIEPNGICNLIFLYILYSVALYIPKYKKQNNLTFKNMISKSVGLSKKLTPIFVLKFKQNYFGQD